MIKNTFGERLKEERTRLGLTQEALGAVGGVKKLAQISYEQDKRYPDAGYLIAIATVGVDVHYVILGKPSVAALSEDESELLAGYRGLDIRGKANMLGMLDVVGTTSTVKPSVKTENNIGHVQFHGKIGQQITGGINAPQTFNMGGKKKKKTLPE